MYTLLTSYMTGKILQEEYYKKPISVNIHIYAHLFIYVII